MLQCSRDRNLFCSYSSFRLVEDLCIKSKLYKLLADLRSIQFLVNFSVEKSGLPVLAGLGLIEL